CRSEPLPASFTLITVNVAGATRPSRTCSSSRARKYEAARATRAGRRVRTARRHKRRSRGDMRRTPARLTQRDLSQQFTPRRLTGIDVTGPVYPCETTPSLGNEAGDCNENARSGMRVLHGK